ncbi:CHAT domain-containing protein [Streptomyces microflavus]|uniref:CHAT domain-containing protein n=1 Tax=Streptomyces microflavus TaxID=1919 RepID=UPI0033BAB047
MTTQDYGTVPPPPAGPPEPPPGAGPAELLDHAEQLLEHHDAQERPEDAGNAWQRCREVLLRARDLLENEAAGADPAALARARFLLGLALSVGYWQASAGHAEAYGVSERLGVRSTAAGLLALARATLPQDTPAYATACVRHGLLLHDRFEGDDAEDDGEGEGEGPHAVGGADARDDDLDEAVLAFDEGVPLLDEAPHPGLLVAYGCALADRYDRDRAPDDLGAAVALLGAVLDELRPPGWEPAEAGAGSWVDEADQLEIEARVRLVTLLQASDDPADAEQAERHLELLAATVPDGHPTRIFVCGHLVDVYREREGGVRPEERPAYLARLRELYRLLDAGSSHLPRVAALLGAALAERVGQSGSRYMPTAENEEATVLLREALAGLAEDDELRLPGHAVLGCLLNRCHDFDPTAYDNEEALLHLERAVDLCPPDDPMRGDLLNQLAHATIVRDDRSPTDLEGVDRTIALLNEMMKVPSDTPGFGSQAHGAYAAALSQRHALSNSSDDLDASIRHLTAAFRQTAVDDVNRVVYLQNLAIALYRRYQTGGDLQDLTTATRYMREVTAVLDGVDPRVTADLHLVVRNRVLLEQALAGLQFMLAFTGGSKAGMLAAVATMRRLQESCDEDAPELLPLEADLGLMLLVVSFFGGTWQERLEGLVLMTESVDALPEDHPERSRLLLRTAGAVLMTAVSPFNRRGVESAEKMLREVIDTVSPDSQEGLRAAGLYANVFYARFLHARAPADADRAVEVARTALGRLEGRAPSPVGTLLTNVLADALRAREAPGDRENARRTGVAGLREAATVVLLQVAAEPALQMARNAADRALQIARWCLADGDPAGAVEAMELGRGQVLHASTTTADVPALLRETGREDLAEEWEGGARAPVVTDLAALLDGPGSLLGGLGEGAELPLPDDLRQRVLTALARSRAGSALMAPPAPGEIGAALRRADADALVYLLPPGGGGGSGGTAVVVTREGEVATVGFGLMRKDGLDVLEAYREAHRHRQDVLDRTDDPEVHTAAHARWRSALEELCDWAGAVVMAPLARSPLLRAAGPQPRLVLVPFGVLGGIPWHAALLSSGLRHGGRPVRAVERMTLSYAASARQLHEVLGRPRLPLDAGPVIVGNPDGTLPGATTEARQIRSALYPRGLLLGRVRGASGPGTPAEVLTALPSRTGPGASVLHLACHARPSGSSPLDACLSLAPPGEEQPDGQLTVREILRQARGRPAAAPGGLVVLDACVSDHTAGDFDESLTLSTAFLAAGATGVVGSRWEVPDGLTGLMMYVFHDRLRAGSPPVRALREAQLWLLDPGREVPGGMPPAVADILNDGDPAALEVWAAFACQGH